MGPVRRRRDAAGVPALAAEVTEAPEEDRYSADDVYYMEPTPMEKDGKLQVAVVVKDKGEL